MYRKSYSSQTMYILMHVKQLRIIIHQAPAHYLSPFHRPATRYTFIPKPIPKHPLCTFGEMEIQRNHSRFTTLSKLMRNCIVHSLLFMYCCIYMLMYICLSIDFFIFAYIMLQTLKIEDEMKFLCISVFNFRFKFRSMLFFVPLEKYASVTYIIKILIIQ